MDDQYISYSLISAVREGRLERVRELISSFGLSYSQAWSKGYVLLRIAVENKHTEISKLLLTNGSKVNSKNKTPSNTPLHFAVINGDIEIVKLLLDSDANIDAKNQYGRTPFHNAVESKKMEIIELLLNRGADVNARNINSITPLHLAVEKGSNEEIIKLLLSRGANVDAKGYLQNVEHLLKHGAHVNSAYTSTSREGYTPLHLAVEKGSEEIIKLLLSRGANVDAKGIDGITSLHIAAERGYLQIVEHLLKRGAHVNSVYTSTSREGYTPLHLAVEKDSEEIIKLLLSRGANVDAKGKDGITSLHIAVERGYLQIVEHLLKHEAYVNFAYTSTSREGYTPLYLAVEKGHEKVVKLLLEYGANVDAQDKDVCSYGKEYDKIVANLLQYGFTVNPEDVNNRTLLHAAVEKGYLEIVQELLKYGTDVNMLYNSRKGFMPLRIATKNKQEKVIKLAISCRADVNVTDEIGNTRVFYATENVNMLHNSISGKGYIPLHIATKNKQEEVAKLLISYGADVNAQDETGKAPIFYATENADLKITQLLLTNKANIKDNPELLNIAVKKDCREIVEVLLQHDADVNTSDKYGRTALHFTALGENGEFFEFHLDKDPDINVKGEIAKLLLSRGANVNARTKNDITTLHAATKKGYVKVVEALLEYNADVNSTVENDITPLHLSAQKGNEVISKMLLNKGANINAKQKDRITALHIATQRGHKKVVEVLLKCGAKVDSKAKSDITPLHIAAQKGHLEVVEVLLKFGAAIDSKNEYGRTALHIASKEGHAQIVTALLEHGSDINIISKSNHTPLDFAMAGISSFYNKVNSYDSDDNYYDPGRGICSCEVIAEILKHHIVKIKTANLYVSGQNLLSFDSNYEIRDFQNKCEKEMASMRSEKIGNSNTSFCDILTKSINQLAILLENENIVQILRSDDYKIKFPVYASMINSHFRKGQRRKELLKQVNKNCYSIFPEVPCDCTQKVLSYLSDEDLRILIDACQPTNVNSSDTNIDDVVL
ncbi:unnamed protein product [Lasius platythorax]|uniref:Uncharacterized protein n=1 Tax=Lasius platythorax TaxID=488582 RepID=A0AAV2NS12_9HYME